MGSSSAPAVAVIVARSSSSLQPSPLGEGAQREDGDVRDGSSRAGSYTTSGASLPQLCERVEAYLGRNVINLSQRGDNRLPFPRLSSSSFEPLPPASCDSSLRICSSMSFSDRFPILFTGTTLKRRPAAWSKARCTMRSSERDRGAPAFPCALLRLSAVAHPTRLGTRPSHCRTHSVQALGIPSQTHKPTHSCTLMPV